MKKFIKTFAKYLSLFLVSSFLTVVILFGISLGISTQYKIQYVTITQIDENNNIVPKLEFIDDDGKSSLINPDMFDVDNNESSISTYSFLIKNNSLSEIKFVYDKDFDKFSISNVKINGQDLIKYNHAFSMGVLKLSKNLGFSNSEEEALKDKSILISKNISNDDGNAFIKIIHNVEKASQSNTTFSFVYYIIHNYLFILLLVYLIIDILLFSFITYSLNVINRECVVYNYNESDYF